MWGHDVEPNISSLFDDYSRYDVVYLIAHKSKALSCFWHFFVSAEDQLNLTLKTLRTNHDREYLSDQFKELCQAKGISRWLIILNAP